MPSLMSSTRICEQVWSLQIALASMNALILIAFLVIVAVVIACWVVIGRLMLKKEIANPHQIFDLWQSGHPVGRMYFRFVCIAFIAFAVICVALMFR